MSDKTTKSMPAETANVSRRSIFQILGTAPAAAALAQTSRAAEVNPHHAHMQMAGELAPAVTGPYQRKIFNDHQWQTVKVLCDLIIPADDRSPAATEAGTAEYIDDWIAFRNQQNGDRDFEAQITGGLIWLDRESNKLAEKKFVELSAAQQKTILDRIAYPGKGAKEDQQGTTFFSMFRDLVVGGFFSSKIGVKDLPYLGNTAVPHWKGCDPKAWAVIEERLKNGYKGILGPEFKPMMLTKA